MSERIPEGWVIEPIGERIAVLTDYTANGSFASLKENVTYYNTPSYSALVRTTDLEKREFKPERFTDKQGHEFLKKSELFPGDIVIANVGSAGKAYRVPRHYRPMTLAPNMYLVKFSSGMDEDFAFQVIISESFQNRLLESCANTTLKAINKSSFRGIEVAVPPLPEQQKIATILSSVDDVIEKTRVQIDKLKDLKTGMMQELLTKGIGHTEFKDSPVGRIPESWSVVRLGDITVEHKQGYYSKERYSENGTYVIRITDMASPKISFTEMPKMVISKDEVEAYRVKEGDFLFARSGAIGRYGIYESKNQAVFASYLIRFRFDPERCINYFIGYCYESDFCQHQIASITQGSSNININANNIKDIMIPLPSVSEQNKICIRLKSLDKRIDLLSLKYQQLNSIKKALMQDLLTGKVRVNLTDKESAVV